MSSSKPQQVMVKIYNMGFGDSFLLTFLYKANERRHMLIDFGSKSLPEDSGSSYMKRVAEQIRKDCGGRLDVVVATHRHQDHINGFATTKAGTGSGDIIRACSPKLVLQPWTEELDADPSGKATRDGTAIHFRQSLASMQGVAESFAGEMAQAPDDPAATRVIKTLRFKGENSVKNKSAVLNLSTMGKPLYLQRGDRPDIEAVLPGVKITVVGPPKPTDAVDFTYAKDSPDYWMRARRAWNALQDQGRRRRHVLKTEDIPLVARWFVNAADRAHREDAMQIVTALDQYMNNTSLILLIEAAGKKLLFPGDAQLESWQRALQSPTVRAALKDIDVYKVGHHGSRNATPKQLWDLFGKKKSSGAKRLVTILSTKDDVFNETFEVPRGPLVTELQNDSDLHDTRTLKGVSEKNPVIL